MTDRKPVWAKCKVCRHTWAVAYLPMDMVKHAKLLKRAMCPNCSASGRNVAVAKQTDGALDEPFVAAWDADDVG